MTPAPEETQETLWAALADVVQVLGLRSAAPLLLMIEAGELRAVQDGGIYVHAEDLLVLMRARVAAEEETDGGATATPTTRGCPS